MSQITVAALLQYFLWSFEAVPIRNITPVKTVLQLQGYGTVNAYSQRTLKILAIYLRQ